MNFSPILNGLNTWLTIGFFPPSFAAASDARTTPWSGPGWCRPWTALPRSMGSKSTSQPKPGGWWNPEGSILTDPEGHGTCQLGMSSWSVQELRSFWRSCGGHEVVAWRGGMFDTGRAFRPKISCHCDCGWAQLKWLRRWPNWMSRTRTKMDLKCRPGADRFWLIWLGKWCPPISNHLQPTWCIFQRHGSTPGSGEPLARLAAKWPWPSSYREIGQIASVVLLVDAIQKQQSWKLLDRWPVGPQKAILFIRVIARWCILLRGTWGR